MALLKTCYAPDIARSLNGILLLCKPQLIRSREVEDELRNRISSALNAYEPRPISERVLIRGDIDSEKSVVEVPNLADHPLVVGPRYLPWELRTTCAPPYLGYRSSGLQLMLLGDAHRYYYRRLKSARLASIYHITGRFGYQMDNFFYDGRIIDKCTFKHIRPGKIDSVLARIQATQRERLFDAASVPRDSQEAYELAKSWPSRPPRMARWPIIYRLRCIHLELPVFKLEVTVSQENETFLAQLTQDIGFLLKSVAHTESIRRVRIGPFDISDGLTDKDWTLESVSNHLRRTSDDYLRLHQILAAETQPMGVKVVHDAKVRHQPTREHAKEAV